MFKGIGKAVGGWFGKDTLKPVDDSLEDDIAEILKRGSDKTSITTNQNLSWCNLTGDDNPLHRDVEAARSYESIDLENIIIVGTLMAATGERISGEVVRKFAEHWDVGPSEIVTTGQQTRFRGIVYPDTNISWKFPEEGYREKRGEVELALSGYVKGEEVITITTSLGKERRRMPEIAGPLTSSRSYVGEQELEAMANCAGYETPQNANMFSASFIPPILLDLQKRLTGRLSGTNASMDFDFYAPMQVGNLQLDVFTPSRVPKKPREGMYFYKFRAIASQGTKPLAYGEITCATPEKMDFTKLSSQHETETS